MCGGVKYGLDGVVFQLATPMRSNTITDDAVEAYFCVTNKRQGWVIGAMMQ